MINLFSIKIADILGILSSLFCLIHCLATPLFLAFGLSFLSSSIFTYFFLIVSFISIFKATKNATHKNISILLWVAFCGFLFSSVFQEKFEWLHYLGYLFAVLIIIGHMLNIKFCKKFAKQTDYES